MGGQPGMMGQPGMGGQPGMMGQQGMQQQPNKQFPMFMGQLQPNMYFKPVWTPKRDAKLQRSYQQIMASGAMNAMTVMNSLKLFGYHMQQNEAQQLLYHLDKNGDNSVSFDEFRTTIQQLCVTYPRTRNPAKPPKPHHAQGYQWSAHPMFPKQYASFWRFG